MIFLKIRKKITNVGGSKGIILDKVIVKSLNLDFGDIIEIDIVKVKNHSHKDSEDTHYKN